MTAPTIEPITRESLEEFARFLALNLNSALSCAQWESALQANWLPARPNFGFIMRDHGNVVGGIAAIYAARRIAGRDESFCNLTSWCVLDTHRKYGMQLALALISQKGFHFTDFSPTAVVGGVLRFLKFRPIDDRQTVVANLPHFGSVSRVVTDPDLIGAHLSGDRLQAYIDHRIFPWLSHLAVGADDNWCHVVFKRRRFKGLPSAHVLHASDPEAFSSHLPALRNYLVTRGMATMHVDTRLLRSSPRPSRIRTGFNAKLVLSSTLEPDQVDYLYSESVAMDL